LLLTLVVAASLGSGRQARAQMAPAAENPRAPVEPVAEAADATDADNADKDAQIDWSQLSADASTLTPNADWKPRTAKPAQPGADLSWSSNDRPNGSAAVAVKQPLWSFWDARVGADMTVARQPATLTESQILSEKLAKGGSLPQSSGTAWAAITAPGIGSIWDKTAVEARVDPAQEQSKLGTTISKSVQLDEQYSVTLQNGTNVIQQGVVPVPGIAGRQVRSYETEQQARLNNADTGTSLIAGQTLSSANDRWLHKLGAEQKLFDGVKVTGSVGETAQGATSKSIGIGFNRSW